MAKDAATILRFDLDTGQTVRPRYLVSQTSRFETITIVAQDSDGASRKLARAFDDLTPAAKERRFYTPLPNVTGRTQRIFVVIGPVAQKITLSQMHLRADIPGSTLPERRSLLILAMLCGMLVMPLGFDAAVFRALKKPFVVWHWLLAMFVLTHMLLVTGVAVALFALDIEQLRLMTLLSFGGMVASAGIFGATFIETGKLTSAWRRALIASGIWVAINTGVVALDVFADRAVGVTLYMTSFLPVLFVYSWSLLHALGKGSRAARYQLIGWIPMAAVGVTRLSGGLTPIIPAHDAMGLFYVATVVEVFATALGMADRLVTIRRQRDEALEEASELGSLSNTDPLTGLINRRGLAHRFEELQVRGFDTFALLDLDHFKAVNDRFGHAKGDEVLKAVGKALMAEPGRRCVAARLGGEEFVLLLQGDDALARAEKIRRSLPAFIAREVPKMALLPSASMGVVVTDMNTAKPIGFTRLYAHADRLLYDAKRMGRNRSVHERMIGFGKPAMPARTAA